MWIEANTMHPSVFVSHANQDKAAVEKLCNELAAHDVDVWTSFKDIPPGAEWDKSIQAALETATHVIVVVSQASTESSYVRAEVEYALDNKKTVIPVLIEEVKLPVRWHTLQHMQLTFDNDAEIDKLANRLPKRMLRNLRDYLKSPGNSNDTLIRAILLDNSHLIQPFPKLFSANELKPFFDEMEFDHLGNEFSVQLEERFISQNEISPIESALIAEYGNNFTDPYYEMYDFLRVLADLSTSGNTTRQKLLALLKKTDFITIGSWTGYTGIELVYLCSPYESGFKGTSGFSDEVWEKLRLAAELTTLLGGNGQESIYAMWSDINVTLLVGQRPYYSPERIRWRDQVIKEWSNNLTIVEGYSANLQIMSYTRIIERTHYSRGTTSSFE